MSKQSESLTPHPSPSAPVTWTAAFDAARCRGESTVWQNLVNCLPPTPPLRMPAFVFCLRPLVPVADTIWMAPSFAPPDPPPRIS